jgi:hypothetical protein
MWCTLPEGNVQLTGADAQHPMASKVTTVKIWVEVIPSWLEMLTPGFTRVVQGDALRAGIFGAEKMVK